MTPRLDVRVARALPTALALVGAVRDADTDRVQEIYRNSDLPALVVALAALVDDTQSPSRLLAWTTPPRGRPEVCGVPSWHASFERHRKRHEECELCRDGERAYQRARYDRRVGARKQQPDPAVRAAA